MRIISAGIVNGKPGDFFDWHTHDDLDELCLVEQGRPSIGHAGVRRVSREDEVLLCRRGELHGFWNDFSQPCRMAVVHFDADALPEVRESLAVLLDAPPPQRVWAFPRESARALGHLLRSLLRERLADPVSRQLAESGWMHLALASLLRLATAPGSAAASPAQADPELDQLHSRLELMVESGEPLEALADTFPGYDSLRHRFRRRFGVSPVTLLRRMRLERAKFLLLNTPLSIKEIASRLGYARQHEFTRTFHVATQQAPSVWRQNPL